MWNVLTGPSSADVGLSSVPKALEQVKKMLQEFLSFGSAVGQLLQDF